MAGDITYIKTQTGWTYLSIVMDLFNREIIGYSISKNIDTELVKSALGNAISRVNNTEGIIFHSDRGSQYRSKGYKNMLDEFGIVKLDANDTIHKKQVEIRKMLKAILKEKGVEI